MESAPTLQHVLASRVFRGVFARFLDSTFCGETLALMVAIEAFKQCSDAELATRAREIHSQFISEDGAMEVNLPNKVKRDIDKQMLQAVYTRTMFDSAYVEVLDILQSDSLPKFLSSDAYKRTCVQHAGENVPCVEKEQAVAELNKLLDTATQVKKMHLEMGRQVAGQARARLKPSQTDSIAAWPTDSGATRRASAGKMCSVCFSPIEVGSEIVMQGDDSMCHPWCLGDASLAPVMRSKSQPIAMSMPASYVEGDTMCPLCGRAVRARECDRCRLDGALCHRVCVAQAMRSGTSSPSTTAGAGSPKMHRALTSLSLMHSTAGDRDNMGPSSSESAVVKTGSAPVLIPGWAPGPGWTEAKTSSSAGARSADDTWCAECFRQVGASDDVGMLNGSVFHVACMTPAQRRRLGLAASGVANCSPGGCAAIGARRAAGGLSTSSGDVEMLAAAREASCGRCHKPLEAGGKLVQLGDTLCHAVCLSTSQRKRAVTMLQPRCSVCRTNILLSEQCCTVGGAACHVDCCRCVSCGGPLSSSNKYGPKPVCSQCNLRSFCKSEWPEEAKKTESDNDAAATAVAARQAGSVGSATPETVQWRVPRRITPGTSSLAHVTFAQTQQRQRHGQGGQGQRTGQRQGVELRRTTTIGTLRGMRGPSVATTPPDLAPAPAASPVLGTGRLDSSPTSASASQPQPQRHLKPDEYVPSPVSAPMLVPLPAEYLSALQSIESPPPLRQADAIAPRATGRPVPAAPALAQASFAPPPPLQPSQASSEPDGIHPLPASVPQSEPAPRLAPVLATSSFSEPEPELDSAPAPELMFAPSPSPVHHWQSNPDAWEAVFASLEEEPPESNSTCAPAAAFAAADAFIPALVEAQAEVAAPVPVPTDVFLPTLAGDLSPSVLSDPARPFSPALGTDRDARRQMRKLMYLLPAKFDPVTRHEEEAREEAPEQELEQERQGQEQLQEQGQGQEQVYGHGQGQAHGNLLGKGLILKQKQGKGTAWHATRERLRKEMYLLPERFNPDTHHEEG